METVGRGLHRSVGGTVEDGVEDVVENVGDDVVEVLRFRAERDGG